MVSAFFSKNAPHKPVNGNACGIFELNKATLMLLVTGDDHKPCAWKAAQTALAAFVAEARVANEPYDLKHWATMAQKSVSQWDNLCAGAGITLSAAVVHHDGRFQCLHWGNNAIFGYREAALDELTPGFYAQLDERVPVIAGQLHEQQGILLLSEGLLKHPKYAFLPDLALWFEMENPEHYSTVLVRKYADGQSEDIIALMLKF